MGAPMPYADLSTVSVRKVPSAVGPQRGLDLVEVLTSVLAADWIDGTIRVERSHPVKGQLGYA
jgi:hypothetical protein